MATSPSRNHAFALRYVWFFMLVCWPGASAMKFVAVQYHKTSTCDANSDVHSSPMYKPIDVCWKRGFTKKYHKVVCNGTHMIETQYDDPACTTSDVEYYTLTTAGSDVCNPSAGGGYFTAACDTIVTDTLSVDVYSSSSCAGTSDHTAIHPLGICQPLWDDEASTVIYWKDTCENSQIYSRPYVDAACNYPDSRWHVIGPEPLTCKEHLWSGFVGSGSSKKDGFGISRCKSDGGASAGKSEEVASGSIRFFGNGLLLISGLLIDLLQ